MNIVQQRSRGKTYIYLRESFWDPVRRKYSSRNIKSYGCLDALLEQNPNFLEELEAEVKALTEEKDRLQEAKVAERASNVARSLSADIAAGQDNRTSMLGPYVLKRVWDRLSLTRKLRSFQGKTNVAFDFPAAIRFLTAARILMPDSKLGQWKRRNQLQSEDKLALHQLYRALDVLIEHKDELIAYLNRQIAKEYKRSVSVVLYDVTTYYFESQNAGDLLNFGFSKDNKVNQVQVVMGLLIDDQGIPIDYELFPGNKSEFSTMVPILEKVQKKYKIERVIVTADRGLNSGTNLLALKELNYDYVIAHRLKSSGQKYKSLVKDVENWTSFSWSSKGAQRSITKYRITDDIRTVKVVVSDGKTETRTIESKLLLNYSPTRAKKDARDRERLVQKAQRLADNPSLLHSELRRGGKSYLSIDDKQLNAVVNEKRIQDAAFWDGYYGITYSDETMTPAEVLKIHHSLWQIEESFRISKSLLNARPCFHWKDQRIRAHFLICYLALVIHRLLELELSTNNVELTAEEIIDALRDASVLEVPLSDKETVYCKANTEGNFEKICSALGLGVIPRIAKETELKRALKVSSL